MKDAGEAAAFVLVTAVATASLAAIDAKILKNAFPKYVGPALVGAAGVAGYVVARATGYSNLALPLLTSGAGAAATALLDRLAGPPAVASVTPSATAAAVAGLPSYNIGEYALYSGEVPGHIVGE